MGRLIEQSFYLRSTKTVARQLLGKVLCRKAATGQVLRGRIVETEAYLGLTDPAAHSFHGKKTERVTVMYQPGGHAYVYLIYGMYDCFNIVTRPEGVPEAVLVRGVEPLQPMKMKTDGPGKLCRAFKITRRHNGAHLWTRSDGIWIEEATQPVKARDIEISTRVGIDYAEHAVDWPLRFSLKNNPFVSCKRRS